MLSHLNRFHGHGSLRYVYRHGKTIRGNSFILKYIENEKRIHPRFAVVVSKKVHKSAVKRNRIRRRIYEVIRHKKAQLSSPIDLVITVLDPGLTDLPHQELQSQFKSLLEKESLLS